MERDTTRRPPAHPRRYRARRPSPHVARRESDEATARHLAPKAQTGGGGASGGGPIDDDGDGRRPDRDGDNATPLLIALGILAIGAAVMSARLLTNAGQRRRIAFRP